MKYTVIYERDEKGWHTYIPSVQGCRTWGRTIEQARHRVREALAASLDSLPESEAIDAAQDAEFVDDIRLPKVTTQAIRDAMQAKIAEQLAAAKHQEASARAAKLLVKEAGLSLRDAGTILSLSHERVKQLASS